MLARNAVTFAAGSLQHRLDFNAVFFLHRHCVAADHGKELSQFFCGGTVMTRVTCVEFSVNPFPHCSSCSVVLPAANSA